MKVATGIWGKSEYGLKGKTPELKSKLMREDEALDMPDEIKDKFDNISLVVDVMHINGNAFMIAKSFHIGHISAVPLTKLGEEEYIEVSTGPRIERCNTRTRRKLKMVSFHVGKVVSKVERCTTTIFNIN